MPMICNLWGWRKKIGRHGGNRRKTALRKTILNNRPTKILISHMDSETFLPNHHDKRVAGGAEIGQADMPMLHGD